MTELPANLNARIEAAVTKHAMAKNSIEAAITKAELSKLRDEVARFAGNDCAIAVFKAAKPQSPKQFLS